MGRNATPSVASTNICCCELYNYSIPGGGGDGGAPGGAGRGDAPGVHGPRHGRDRARVELVSPALVFQELDSRPGAHGVGSGGEEMPVLGAGLGLDGPPHHRLLPQVGEPGELGEGEGDPFIKSYTLTFFLQFYRVVFLTVNP